jgi:hypothetical protein
MSFVPQTKEVPRGKKYCGFEGTGAVSNTNNDIRYAARYNREPRPVPKYIEDGPSCNTVDAAFAMEMSPTWMGKMEGKKTHDKPCGGKVILERTRKPAPSPIANPEAVSQLSGCSKRLRIVQPAEDALRRIWSEGSTLSKARVADKFQMSRSPMAFHNPPTPNPAALVGAGLPPLKQGMHVVVVPKEKYWVHGFRGLGNQAEYAPRENTNPQDARRTHAVTAGLAFHGERRVMNSHLGHSGVL